ncbi:hypothetical protein [Catalinimonas niigatensis]|uniref:hypothetical protein n=1 Tax=Catalinimonas niigatensis TaxID=1397264 RepID=UPI002665BE8A|nr:hypothetical protein [Catalinimonas niigatensis]WPP52996.1 hypothetical protein PZB72_11480 [Catalinimonas niigatensis]
MHKIISMLFMLLLTSCAEDVLTSGEIAGNELQSQADRLKIETVWVYEWSIHGNGYSQYSKVNEGSFSISGQFLKVNNSFGGAYYNLDKLQSFTFDQDREIILIYLK